MKKVVRLFHAVVYMSVAAFLVWAALPVLRHMSGIVVLEVTPLPELPEQRQADLSAIAAFAPFGHPDAIEIAAQQPSVVVPNFVLRGVMLVSEGRSAALIAHSGRTQAYGLGEEVAGGYEVMAIAQKSVELGTGTSNLFLRLDETAQETPGSRAKVEPSGLDRLKDSLVLAEKYQKPSKPETTSEHIDYWRKRILKNPQAVLDEIGLEATESGYLIKSRHDIGVKLAGFKSGDMVRRVNGQAVGNPDADRKFYDEIAATGEARVEVERGGKLLSFSFSLR